jgi:ABC-type dipeptide/oligopeptide/nickel transport system permease component
MKTFLFRRLLILLPVLWGVITLVFSFIHIIPGDPVVAMLGEQASAADVLNLREQLKLNEPLHIQYFLYIKGLIKGDLGISLITEEPVSHIILKHYPATIELALASILIALALSLPLGILSATHKNKPIDHVSRLLALLGLSMPNFWLGPMLIIIFSLKLNIFPVSGPGGLNHLILPAVTLGTAMAAFLTRMIRSSMLEELSKEYIRTARAKGLSKWRIIFKHALKNALIPVITIIGLQFGILLTGAIITETIFSWPGIGRMTIQAIQQRNYPLVQGALLFISVTYIFINTITDIAYAWLNPRIRFQK